MNAPNFSTSPAFISLDGLDGTGKSTQCRLLKDWLEAAGVPCEFCVDPGGTSLGGELRAILLDRKSTLSLRTEALLFMASRAQLIEEKISPALEAGKVVVSDRYLLANLVYQGYAGGLPIEVLRTIGLFAAKNLLPGLVLVLDLPLEEAITRRGRAADRMEARSLEFHQKVRDGFRQEALDHPETHRLIDARPSLESVQAQLREEITTYLESIGHPAARRLKP